jgi:hypothetical protein
MSYDWLNVLLNYAYYNDGKAVDVHYCTLINENSCVTLSGSRVNAFASIELGKDFSFNSSFNFFVKRSAIVSLVSRDNYFYGEADAMVFANFFALRA